MPERPGNRLADSLSNLLANPRIGLLFIVPGLNDTFRVNGHATITVDAELLALSAVEGKPPLLKVVVEIDEAYTQCSKAFLRSHLWDPQRFVDPTGMLEGVSHSLPYRLEFARCTSDPLDRRGRLARHRDRSKIGLLTFGNLSPKRRFDLRSYTPETNRLFTRPSRQSRVTFRALKIANSVLR